MAIGPDRSRLDEISTHWTLLRRIQQSPERIADAAKAEFLARYGGAVRRYLRGAAKDADAADDLYQDFAYRFLHGDLRGACAEKGRLRDFLKGVLSHLAADFHKRRQRQPGNLPGDLAEAELPALEHDRLFQQSWRDELLAKAWEALKESERCTGQPFFTVLRFRADHPDMRSPAMALRLGEMLQRPMTPAAARQLLHRARQRFGELFRKEVMVSLNTDDPDQLEKELEALGLLACLQRQPKKAPKHQSCG